MKIGFGYDSHRFLTDDEINGSRGKSIDTGTDLIDPKKPLILGGVTVEGHRPFKARSDGDVVMHAAANAILSALGEPDSRDIGVLFPNTDPKNSNRPGRDILAKACAIARRGGYAIGDLKLTIKGKVRVDLAMVEKNLSAILECERGAVHMQGTSGEEMDASGRGEGVEVFGVCVLMRA